MKKTKAEKGITLMALIITIVVSLSLSAVAIGEVKNDGIINHAKNARDAYEKAQKNEQETLSYFEKYLEPEKELGEWIQNKTKLTRVNSDGTVDELEVGDLITNYKSATNTSIAWKVLGAEDGKVLLVSATNVTTEELNGADDCINDVGINRLNTICADYDDGIGALENSGRSIKIDDIDRITGYNPLKTGTGEPYYYYIWEGITEDRIKRVSQYKNKVTYTINEDGKVCYAYEYDSNLVTLVSKYAAKYQKFQHIDGTVLVKESEYTGREGTTKSITVENDFYAYYPVSLSYDSDTTGEVKGISAESNAYELLFEGTETESNYYWLSSPYVFAADGHVEYGVQCVKMGIVDGDGLFKSLLMSYNASRGIRAVISLKSDVNFKKVGDNTYTISVAD